MGVYEPYDKLVNIRVMGHPVQVPEKNRLLRGFQYACPDSVPYGRFCWNNECGNCELSYRLAEGAEERVGRGCQLVAVEGMEVTKIAFEIKYNLGEALTNAPAAPKA